VTAVDRLGAVSAPSAPVTITVRKSDPPSVAITAPRRGQRVKLPRRGLEIRGTASDELGVASVEVSMRLATRAPPRSARAGTARRRRRTPTTCSYFSGARRLVKGSCRAFVFFRVKLRRGGAWSFKIPGNARLPRSRYELRVRGTDTAGNRTTRFSQAERTLVPFTLK
jgi:hypothetical protein